MATQAVYYQTGITHSAFAKALVAKRDALIASLTPRPCITRSIGLILLGMCIPLLTALGAISASLLLNFIGLALMGAGVVLLLVFCGEI